MTAQQIGACLGFIHIQSPPLSLYHKEFCSDNSFDLYRQIWNWCLANIKSTRIISFKSNQAHAVTLIKNYLAIHHRETECHISEITEFQKKPLAERVQQFRAIGPMNFIGNASDKKCYQFSIDKMLMVAKFRIGDFLKLSPIGTNNIQDGFSVILHTYSPKDGVVTVRPLSQKAGFSKNQLYALDEDATDWNTAKIAKILNLLQNRNFNPEVIKLLLGHTKNFASNAINWIEQWYPSKAPDAKLNHLQKKALALPFREKIGLIRCKLRNRLLI
jgi:hypothetical protein